MKILTVAEIQEQNLALLESELGQTAPINPKAFLRVLAKLEAYEHKPLYNLAVQRAKENLALTATREGLIILRDNLSLVPKPAEAAILEIELPGIDSTVIPATVDFIGVPNGVRYYPSSSSIIAGGVALIEVTAETLGVIGNLQIGDELTIGTQIAGAETVATVKTIINTGVEDETTEALRARVLNRQKAQFGGGNSADYRAWSLEVAGVDNAYPYSGRPITDEIDSVPPQRTIYILASTTIDPDGLAPQNLLDEVRDNIITDPVTGLHRQALGLTNDTLFVESIRLTAFYIQINGLDVSADIEANVKDEIKTALTNYFLSIQPFVDGLDSELERNDLITDLTVSEVVQDVLSANGGSATGVSFGLSVGTSLPSYRLNQGELSKLAAGGITYV